MKRRTFVVDRPAALGAAVASTLEEPLSNARQRVEAGAVFVDGRRVKDWQRTLVPGATVSVVLEVRGMPSGRPGVSPPALVVLFEDDEVFAVDKPPGLAAQPTPGGAPNLLDLASARLGRPAGLVHRLDRDTSGVMVFGKTKEATRALAAAFRDGRVEKTYLALVASGIEARGRVDTPLQKDPSRPGRFRATRSGGGVSAETDFERVWDDGAVALVRLRPRTGRTHQLRAHLASLGFPIVGDALYGGMPGPRCLLHASRLVIEGRSLDARLPSDFPLRGP